MTGYINSIHGDPQQTSRRPWTAEACCRFPGASPLARHPTSPPPQQAIVSSQPASRRLWTAGSNHSSQGARSARGPLSQQALSQQALSEPAPPNQPISNLKFQILPALLTSHFSLPPTPLRPSPGIARLRTRATPQAPPNQPLPTSHSLTHPPCPSAPIREICGSKPNQPLRTRPSQISNLKSSPRCPATIKTDPRRQLELTPDRVVLRGGLGALRHVV